MAWSKPGLLVSRLSEEQPLAGGASAMVGRGETRRCLRGRRGTLFDQHNATAVAVQQTRMLADWLFPTIFQLRRRSTRRMQLD
jgi:hypothetical protein